MIKVRERSHLRFGGAAGLGAEKAKREAKKWAGVMEKTEGALRRKD